MPADDGVLVVGGGYAGLWAGLSAAREFAAKGEERTVRLLTRQPFLTARPRLYERDLSESDAHLPLAGVLEMAGIELVLDEAVAIDADAPAVVLADGRRLGAEALVLTAGSQLTRPPIPGLAEHAESVDNAAQASHLWRRLEAREGHAPNVSVIGGGFTGIELAAELAGWRIQKAPGATISLIDRGVIGAGYSEPARRIIDRALADLGVHCHSHASAQRVGSGHILLASGERFRCDVPIWTAGLAPSPLVASIEAAKDHSGRMLVDGDLRVPGYPGVYAAGDVAAAPLEHGRTTVMSCQYALSSGVFAGHNAACALLGEAGLAYTPRPYVTCLDLGLAGALLTAGFDRSVELHGEPAKVVKRRINRQLILPPAANSRNELLDAAAPLRWSKARVDSMDRASR